MKLHILAIMAIILTITSCSENNPEKPNTGTPTNSKEAPPPSIIQTPAVATTQKKTEQLKIDLEKHQVLISSEGWISIESFWDIYNNHPEKLPGDIDFDLLQKLKDLPDPQPSLTNEHIDPLGENKDPTVNSNPAEESNDPANLGGHPAEIISNPTEELNHPVEKNDNPADDAIHPDHITKPPPEQLQSTP